MPRSCGLMRPSGRTAVASVSTRPPPPAARLPRCTRCQSLAYPLLLEYSHMGETNMRFGNEMPRIARGSNRGAISSYGKAWDHYEKNALRRTAEAKAHRDSMALIAALPRSEFRNLVCP